MSEKPDEKPDSNAGDSQVSQAQNSYESSERFNQEVNQERFNNTSSSDNLSANRSSDGQSDKERLDQQSKEVAGSARDGNFEGLSNGLNEAYKAAKGDSSKFNSFGNKLKEDLSKDGINVSTDKDKISFEKEGKSVDFKMKSELDFQKGEAVYGNDASSPDGGNPKDVVAGFKSDKSESGLTAGSDPKKNEKAGKNVEAAQTDSDRGGFDSSENSTRNEKEGLDKDGRDKEGLDKDGRDKEGLDKDGRDKEGLDKDGRDKEGLDKDGRDKEGLDKDGRDKEGLDKDGRDKEGLDKDADKQKLEEQKNAQDPSKNEELNKGAEKSENENAAEQEKQRQEDADKQKLEEQKNAQDPSKNEELNKGAEKSENENAAEQEKQRQEDADKQKLEEQKNDQERATTDAPEGWEKQTGLRSWPKSAADTSTGQPEEYSDHNGTSQEETENKEVSTLLNPKASLEDKLVAARDLASKGVNQFKGENGQTYDITKQKYGKEREGVVVSTTDKSGKFAPVLRGIVGKNGEVSHQKDRSGHEVSYAGDRASKVMPADPVLSTTSKTPNREAEKSEQGKRELEKQDKVPLPLARPEQPSPTQTEKSPSQVPPQDRPKPAVGPLGTKFVPQSGAETTTKASFYDKPQPTASGRYFNPQENTVAHKTLPMGTVLKISNPKTGQSTTAVVTDRGPYVGGRGIDLSPKVARDVGISHAQGVGTVTYKVIGKEPGFRDAPKGKRT